MKVRLQADADFNHDIVRAVLRRDPSADFQSAVEAGREGIGRGSMVDKEALERDRERFQRDTSDGQLALFGLSRFEPVT